MSLLDNLEHKLGFLALPRLTLGLVIFQVAVFIAVQAMPRVEGQESLPDHLLLIPDLVLAGQVWRLASFLIVPPIGNIVCALFFWYLFYLMGTALEHYWGTFRFNVYFLIGYVATVAVAFLVPDQPATNGFLQASVFLAFAFLNPDFELYLFFLLPVKIKWLALLTWIGYFYMVIVGDWLSRLLVLASVCNFLLFFGWDILARVQTGRRRMAVQAARFAVQEQPYYHRCTVCGITDRTHPQMDFRYCSTCTGAHAYCQDHLANHQHILEAGGKEMKT
jgi:hypothetical protein